MGSQMRTMHPALRQAMTGVIRAAAMAVAALAGLAVLAAPALAQGGLRGVVRDSLTGQPLPAVTVAIRTAQDSILAGTLTDEAGRFALPAVTYPGAILSLRRIGLRPVDRSLPAGGVGELELRMLPVAAELDTVTAEERKRPFMSWVTAGSEIFARNQQQSRGLFFTRQDLIWSGKRVDEFFSVLPGLTVERFALQGALEREDGQWITSTRYRCVTGRVDWVGTIVGFTDTLVVFRGGTFTGAIKLGEIRGIEYYASGEDIPRDWGGSPNRRCAFIQLWTDRGW
jgi:hypothetical protein